MNRLTIQMQKETYELLQMQAVAENATPERLANRILAQALKAPVTKEHLVEQYRKVDSLFSEIWGVITWINLKVHKTVI